MAEQPNRQAPNGGERLDRIERRLALLPGFRVGFREEYKHLLSAQVLLTGSLEKLTDDLRSLTQRVDQLAVRLDQPAVRMDPANR